MKINIPLVNWYQEHKRDFPWRQTRKFYPIWICEIIFQQTRIAQGMDFYKRFMLRFPSIDSLANADEQQVLAVWQGLGYYSRARNLHATAKQLVSQKTEPKSYAELLVLKGIGSYTAAAIASICFEEKVPAIDGNALRVYARIYMSDKNIAETQTRTFFFELIKPLLQDVNAGDFNQAVMELGALICTPKNPSCEICPVSNQCKSFKNNKTAEFPIKIKNTKVVEEQLTYFLYLTKDYKIAIKKRINKGIWQNMYEFSTHDYGASKNQQRYEFTHKLSHKKLFISILLNPIEAIDERFNADIENVEWIYLSDYKNFPFPIIFSTFLKEIPNKSITFD